MVNTRRNIRLTLAFGFGAVFVIALTGLVYFPAFGLAALGFIGVVIASSLIMARGTSRWSQVWIASAAGILWIGSIVVYWILWDTAFTYRDDNKIVPPSIDASLAATIISGGAAFSALVVAATVIHIRASNLPKPQATFLTPVIAPVVWGLFATRRRITSRPQRASAQLAPVSAITLPQPRTVSEQDEARTAESLVVSGQFASVSMLQRKMGVTFVRARELMTQLEATGTVGPATRRGTRAVLVSRVNGHPFEDQA